MVKDEKKAAPAFKLNVKIVSYGDYLTEAKEMLLAAEDGKVNGMISKRDIAISILCSKNKVLHMILLAGETKFVCEA